MSTYSSTIYRKQRASPTIRIPVTDAQPPQKRPLLLAPLLIAAIINGIVVFHHYPLPGQEHASQTPQGRVEAAAPAVPEQEPVKPQSAAEQDNPAKPPPEPQPAAPAAPPVQSPDADKLNQQINAIIAQYPGGNISVAITDLKTGAAYTYGDGESFRAASIGKLLTATLFLHEVEQGNQSLDASIAGYDAEYLLQRLVEQSGNDAWIFLDRQLGSSALQAWAAQNGLASYSAATNTINAPDTASLLAKLHQGQLLNPAHTQLLLSYMQQANYTEYIRSAVPANIAVYHKAGILDDRVLDSAIIDNGSNPFVLVIFTSSVPAGATGVFQTVTGSAVKAFVP